MSAFPEMSAPEGTVWRMEPHTGAKHRILREWWNGWLPILAKRHPRLIYFDGFAGPGTYLDRQPGSPIVAIRAALAHKLKPYFEKRELSFYLVEKREDRARCLEREIAAVRPSLPSKWSAKVIKGSCTETLSSALDGLEELGARLAPTYAFLDPFGFKDLPMDLVSRLLSYKWCDVLITFVARDINRFAESPLHFDGINQCLGSSDWRNGLPEGADERRSFFIRTYENEILNRVPKAHVRSFEMSGHSGPIYYLVGVTKHKEGVKVMKHAMWSADPTGSYRFSDRTAGQSTLMQWQDEPSWSAAAADCVYQRFKGVEVPVEEIEDFILFETPWEFKKRSILGQLEEKGLIIQVRNRPRRGSWPDGSVMVFR